MRQRPVSKSSSRDLFQKFTKALDEYRASPMKGSIHDKFHKGLELKFEQPELKYTMFDEN